MALKEKIIDKAQKLVQKGYLDKAIVEYRAAVDVDPKDISIRLRIGDLYVKLGKKADAIKEYTEAARANAQRGFYLKAIAVYKQVLKLEENLEIHNKLAELYVKQRLIADAVGEYSYIVTWFERRGKTSDVLEILKKMVEIDPENVGVRLKLAELYQKLSFDKDALSEYCLIFDKLVASGKLDTAEKVFLQLYNTNPAEERVLSGLAELYRLKRDDTQRLRFLKGLFNHYSDSAMLEQARNVASDIIQIKPDDPHALRLLKKEEKKREEASSPKADIRVEAASESPAPEAAAEVPLISWPEEEIEVTIEGFEEGAGEENAATGLPAQASAQEASLEEAPVPTESPVTVESAPVEEVKTQAMADSGTGEIEIDIEDLLKGELPPMEEKAAAPASAAPDEVIVPEAAVEETAPGQVADASGAPPAIEETIEEPAEEAGLEEAISVISVELQDSQAGTVEEGPGQTQAPVAEEAPVVVAEAEAEAQMPEPPIDEAMEVPERAEVISESVEAAEEALETIIEEVKLEVEPEVPEQVLEIEAGPATELPAVEEENTQEAQAPEAVEAVAEAAAEIEAAPAEALEVEEVRAEPVIEEAPVPLEAGEQPWQEKVGEAAMPAESEAETIVAEAPESPVSPVSPSEEELQEDLSSAIQELMEKMEPAETEAPLAAQPQEAAAHEEYVDLSVELGMEEASKDIAGAWGGKESAETFDEFKTGIGKQLSKEDSETHYNLGIAYMEMELYGEAAKEFKIALKDARLELDCYTRLGLCAMAEDNPHEAAVYYSKGLKAASTDEEKKGMMYELALAHEAAGQDEAALELFTGIFAMDPDFREVASKVSANALSRPLIPLNDGLIEVELL